MQWDTSEHDWLEGRGPKLYLISMLDDATSRLLARFVEHDSTEENMRLLKTYLQQHGRPLSFYTDKATLFANLPKTRRGEVAGQGRAELPPTQIGRALKELDIEWIAAHSPQTPGMSRAAAITHAPEPPSFGPVQSLCNPMQKPGRITMANWKPYSTS